MNHAEWAARWPQAAQELNALLTQEATVVRDDAEGKSESWAQQQIRFQVAQAGGLMWRNNVGGAKVQEHLECPKCRFKFVKNNPPLRWGLCNDSAKLNKVLKSSDLIGVLPVTITPAMVGRTIGQFVSIEVKVPGWVPKFDEHERAQQRWLALLAGKGALTTFSTGDVRGIIDGGTV